MAVKSAVYDYSLYTPDYYLKGFLAGGVCCSVTRCVESIHCAALRAASGSRAESSRRPPRPRRDALLHFHTQVTHGGATPIDFVKTRMQLVPELG